MAVIASEEVPFETAGQIEEKLAMFEKLMGLRYTMRDKGFAKVSQKEEK